MLAHQIENRRTQRNLSCSNIGYRSAAPDRQETEPPTLDTIRIPTAISLEPQLKSLYSPVGPDPARNIAFGPTSSLGPDPHQPIAIVGFERQPFARCGRRKMRQSRLDLDSNDDVLSGDPLRVAGKQAT